MLEKLFSVFFQTNGTRVLNIAFKDKLKLVWRLDESLYVCEVYL